MKLNVVEISGPNKDTVAKCEQLLELAKSGTVQNVIIATIDREGSVSTGFTDGLNLALLAFAMKVLELRANDYITGEMRVDVHPSGG